MRKISGFSVLFIAVLLYLVSSDQAITVKLNLFKEKSDKIWRSDKHRYGDLFGMAYLSNFKKTIKDSLSLPPLVEDRKIDLYEICDSYMFEFFNDKRFYYGVDKFTMIKTNYNETLKVKPDAAKLNILLLEFSERNVRVLLEDTDYVKNLIGNKSDNAVQSGLKQKVKDSYHFLFNKDINTNLEYNIWDYSLFTPLKEFKADINYKFFNTIDKNVVISKNGKQLFFAQTIDTTQITSSFKYLPDEEVNTLIKQLNAIFKRANAAGFNKVYLSIIPNPVSILASDYNGLHYNNLVTRVQSSPKLQIPVIDIWSEFNHSKTAVYLPSDTHWNWRGGYMWLKIFNCELIDSYNNAKTN